MYISIDPGLNFSGITYFDLKDNFKVLELGSINNSASFGKELKQILEKHGNKHLKLDRIISFFESFIKDKKIDTCIFESPFFALKSPNAYSSIVEYTITVSYNVMYKNDIRTETISPLEVKKGFTGKAFADKLLMKDFLIDKINKKEIELPEGIIVDQLTEHQIDSIAVGYVWSLSKK